MRCGKIVSIELLVAACFMAPGFAQAREGMHDGCNFTNEVAVLFTLYWA